jgi:hypothetical protein
MIPGELAQSTEAQGTLRHLIEMAARMSAGARERYARG